MKLLQICVKTCGSRKLSGLGSVLLHSLQRIIAFQISHWCFYLLTYMRELLRLDRNEGASPTVTELLCKQFSSLSNFPFLPYLLHIFCPTHVDLYCFILPLSSLIPCHNWGPNAFIIVFGIVLYVLKQTIFFLSRI